MSEATWKPHEKDGTLTTQSMCRTQWRGSVKSPAFRIPTLLWHSRRLRKPQPTTALTSPKCHGAT